MPYFRFNPPIPRFALDETSPPKLAEMQALGREHMAAAGATRCAELAAVVAPTGGVLDGARRQYARQQRRGAALLRRLGEVVVAAAARARGMRDAAEPRSRL